MAGPGEILIRVGAQTADAVRDLNKVDKALGDTMSGSEKMSAGLRKAALPAAAALGAITVAAVGATKAAMEDAAEQEKLASALARVTDANTDAIAATEDWITKTSLATGVADSQLRPALETIATATGDVAAAQGYLSQALDISAASGKDLETVSAAIAKAHEGQTGALAKLVPGLDGAAKASKDFDVIMAALAETTGGAATDAANTAEGQYKRFQLQLSELYETLGTALIPVIEALLPLLRSAATFAGNNTTAIKILIGVVAAFSAAILVANVAMKAYAAAQVVIRAATVAWTAVQWLLNAALTANPIGAVIVAVAALTAAIVLLWRKSETFRSIVLALWEAFKRFTVLGQIISHFDELAAAVQRVIDAVSSLIGWISRIKIPHIDLPGPFSAIAPVAGGGFPSPLLRRPAVGGRASSGPVTINVYGAIDPEGTARAVRRLLDQQSRRWGVTPA